MNTNTSNINTIASNMNTLTHNIYSNINSNIIILTFIITGLCDVLLRYIVENISILPNFFRYDFVYYLIPYFKYHTVLSGGLIAGFVGALTQIIILYYYDIVNINYDVNTLVNFISVSFIISALFGFVMKFSKLFPILDKTYYKHLGTIRGMYHDGISGIIVQIILLIILYCMR
jgi:hypothetical protein